MTLVLWTTLGLVVWLVLWAIGAKSFDAFMVSIVIILIGATLGTLTRYLPSRR